ncbi:MAG: hypothetical protein NC226_09305 [Bacteroides cellulosilyticus]|nr:hypothetical protein [Bacteroides cellulosilyticus]
MKNILEKFAKYKSIATFVMTSIITGKRKPANIAGIFCALAILFAITAVTPVWSVNAPTACDGWKSTGKDSRFSCPQCQKDFQMAGLILSKESSASEIKRYFNAVLELSKSDNEFPINLDEVWMLVYSEKSKAVRALKENFIENVDFRPLAQNGERTSSGQFAGGGTIYYLTLPCMEFFIARKVRPVFEVYRQVFHKVARISAPKVSDRIRAAKFLASFLNLNESSKLLLAMSIADPLGLPTPDYTPSKGVLRSCAELLKEHGANLSPQQFNQKMIQHGYMTELERPSSKGGVKRFKSIVADGLQYGENQVNPNNPKSTQPLYYVEKFGELLTAIAG